MTPAAPERGLPRPLALVLALALALAPAPSCTASTHPASGADAAAARDASAGTRDAWPPPDASAGDSAAASDGYVAPDALVSPADAAPPDAGPPPPPCEELGGDARIGFDPPAPWDGGSVRIRVTASEGYTHVGVRLLGSPAAPEPRWIGVEGSGPYTWSWSVSPLATGAWCVELFADPAATVLQRRLLRVAATPPEVAPFKVTRNHQWTCEEEYTWAINLDVRVEDETGGPLPGARVLLEHPPCDLRDQPEPPAELVTGADGEVRWENYYPFCFFHLRVADAPSDTAIELYTGIWETQPSDGGGECNYCSTFAENVWGHWSYSVTFRRTPGATERCEVGSDHAGQAGCAPLVHWEEPSAPCAPL